MSQSSDRPERRPERRSERGSERGSARAASSRRNPQPRSRKQPAKKRHWLRGLILTVIVVGSLGFAAFALLVARTEVPTPNEVATSEATIVYYADGTREIGRLGEATRRSVPLDTVPIDVQRAVLAAEDRTFYEHGGISPIGIARAAFNNVVGSGNTQGGSTITQQYAKNAFLTQDRTWDRKIREALLAFKLETLVSKDQILEDYLNTIYFGRGAYGVEAAAIAYFGVPVTELDASQGAALAAIIKSPSTLTPEENPDALRARWNYVLDGMVEMGWLTQEQRDATTFPEFTPYRAENRLGGQTGYLLTAVERQLLALGFDETEIQRGGLKITSSFDRRAQRAAVKAVRDQGPDSNTEGLRLGLASVRPGTGEVVAMYGGKDFIDDQINNALQPFAQAGSTFKTFALAAGLQNGVPLNSLWPGDSPSTVNGYTFNNYGNKSYGIVTLLQATELSINSAYVEMEADIGVQSVADAALAAGIPETTPGLNLESLDLTFVLGTASPSALDVANAYATFAARGVRAEPTFVTRVEGPNGGVLYEHEVTTTAAFDTEVSDTVNYALSRVVTNGTGTTARALDRPAAGKTGTTDGNRSAWFAGYTPQLATAVLMAKEDASGMPVSLSGTGGLATVTGGSFPAAIWTEYMAGALKDQPVEEFAAPPSGALAPVVCPEFPEPGAEVPMGCEAVEVETEFGPEDSGIPIVEPTDQPVDPAQPSNEFGPETPPSPEATLPADTFGPENDGRATQ